jgi:choline-sulfatase
MSQSTKPNVLIIMADEHAPQFSGLYGHSMVRTPNLDRLGSEGVVFDGAYCNSPLCVPSRMSLMTGRLASADGVYDNASPLASDTVTWAHLLRSVGYDVALAGKQHFVGPDQLHGFNAQLAHDLHASALHPIYSWDDGVAPATEPWFHFETMGPGITPEIETDDEVERQSLNFIRSKADSEKPWVLMSSFIAPHFPFIAPEKYWDMYDPALVDMPDLPPGHLESQHPLYARLRSTFGVDHVAEDQIRRARAGYYALMTYLDDKIGTLLAALDDTGQSRDTIVVYTADHGEMLGEHGLWRKSAFYEHSARVPLVIRWPGVATPGRRIPEAVSLIDLVATLIEIAGAEPTRAVEGASLTPLLAGDDPEWKDEAISEYLAHGVLGPMAMLRRGRYKFNYVHGEGPELYDLEADPGELTNLAESPEHRPVLDELRAALLDRWDPQRLDSQVRQSQRDRMIIRDATSDLTKTADSSGALVWGSADTGEGPPTR